MFTLGIDLGTTYSAAAVWEDGRTQVFDLGERSPQIPSVVAVKPDGEVLVGEAAERRAVTDPTRTARESDTDNSNAQFSPDGESIVFNRSQGGEFDLLIVGVDGSDPQPLVVRPGVNDVDPRWSPDSGRILFSSIAQSGPTAVQVVNADGSDVTDVTPPDFLGFAIW